MKEMKWSRLCAPTSSLLIYRNGYSFSDFAFQLLIILSQLRQHIDIEPDEDDIEADQPLEFIISSNKKDHEKEEKHVEQWGQKLQKAVVPLYEGAVFSENFRLLRRVGFLHRYHPPPPLHFICHPSSSKMDK